MTRNAVRAMIALCIARQAIESSNTDVDLSWLSTDQVLQCMEDAGMLPPMACLCFLEGKYDNAWEPEDQYVSYFLPDCIIRLH